MKGARFRIIGSFRQGPMILNCVDFDVYFSVLNLSAIFSDLNPA